MPAMRNVSSVVYKPTGDVWSGGTVRFTLTQDTYSLAYAETYPIRIVDVITASDGAFDVDLVADLTVPYKCRMPDGEEFFFYLPLEDGSPVALEELRNIYDGVPPTALVQLRGDTGPTGPAGGRTGPGTVVMTRTFSTTTADADPGNGTLRLNAGTQNTATQAFIDLLNTGGTDQTALLDSLDDSTSTTSKGQIRIEKQLDSTIYLLANLTAVTTATGYRKLVFTIVGYSSSSPFTNGDALYVTWTRTGDLGTTGPTGPAGATGATGATGAAGPIGGSTTQVIFNDAGAAGGDAGLTYAKTTDTLSAGRIILAAGAAGAGNAPMKFTGGTSLTTPEAGAVEFDSSSWYGTHNTTSNRSILTGWHEFRIPTSVSAIGPTIADFFGANSSINLPTLSMWYLEAQLAFLKSTAGTVTWTVVNSAANYLDFTGWLEIDAVGGGTGFQAVTRANIHNTTTASNAFPATGSITDATNHIHRLACTFQVNAAGNIRIRVTSSAGTVTPLPNSFYRIRRMPGNAGNFVA